METQKSKILSEVKIEVDDISMESLLAIEYNNTTYNDISVVSVRGVKYSENPIPTALKSCRPKIQLWT